jgi:hypothetical protein
MDSKIQSEHMPFNPQEMTAVEIHPAIAGLIWSLPWWDNQNWEPSRRWTKQERDAWIKAFVAVTDLIEEEYGLKKEIAPAVVAEAPKKEKSKPVVLESSKMPDIPEFVPAKSEVPVEKFSAVEPYTGKKRAAEIVMDLIKQAGKAASVWMHKSGRVRIGRPDREGDQDEKLVGVYTPEDASKTEIMRDLRETERAA